MRCETLTDRRDTGAEPVVRVDVDFQGDAGRLPGAHVPTDVPSRG